jgi:hypothetical protein
MHKLVTVCYHVERQSNSHSEQQIGCLHKCMPQGGHITIGNGAVIPSFAISCTSLSLYPRQSEVSLYWMIPIQGLDAFWYT